MVTESYAHVAIGRETDMATLASCLFDLRCVLLWLRQVCALALTNLSECYVAQLCALNDE